MRATPFGCEKNGLAVNYVGSICIDPQGNKWVGTWGGGIQNLTILTGLLILQIIVWLIIL